MYYITEEEFNSNKILRINKNINDLENIVPSENINHPGFYIIPGYNDLLISKDYKVLKISLNRLLKETYDKNSYGYIRTRVGYEEGNKSIRLSLSRLIAITFIGRPSRHIKKSYKVLQVNHINGNPSDNTLYNLEWCINKENIQHANQHLEIITDTPVLAKNIFTNEIKRFKNLTLCSKYFNISKTTLHYHLTTDVNLCNGVKNNHIFKYDDNSNWCDLNKTVNTFEIGTGRGNSSKQSILAKNIFTGDIKTFNSIKECSDFFNLIPNLLVKNLISNIKNKAHKDGWIFKYKDDNKIWCLYPFEEMYELGQNRVIKPFFYNNKLYKSIKDLRTELVISKTTAYRLYSKSKQQNETI